MTSAHNTPTVQPGELLDDSALLSLEDLARTNGLWHEKAHDALSDVQATIALARLIQEKQPKLFDFALGLHKKDGVLKELGLPATATHARPFLHVSGMIPAERGCLTLMWPLAQHPVNKNEIIAWDLRADPSELRSLDADTLRQNIRRCKELTDKPFGVNIMLMHPQADEFAKIVVEEGVKVVTTGAGNPGKYIPMWKEAGIKVIPVVAAAVLAKHLAPLGVDAVIAEGTESGGHVGEMTTMASSRRWWTL